MFHICIREVDELAISIPIFIFTRNVGRVRTLVDKSPHDDCATWCAFTSAIASSITIVENSDGGGLPGADAANQCSLDRR